MYTIKYNYWSLLPVLSLSLSLSGVTTSRHPNHPSNFPFENSKQLTTAKNVPMIRTRYFAIPTVDDGTMFAMTGAIVGPLFLHRRSIPLRKQFHSKQGGIDAGNEKQIEPRYSER
mmetsp:Transcript_13005/g.26473  ORF Transcript_13005/g.26473 Transcript_13005/m.26473 type:complete len:115 (-) Transcript_13005:435-779(-)